MSTSDLGSTLPGGSRTRRASIILLGKEVEVDPLVLSRVERAERAAAVLMVITLVTYALNGASNVFLSVLAAISSTAFFFSLFVVYYKNFSFAIVKRLFKEVEVLILLLAGFVIFIIDCTKPSHTMSPANGFLYFAGLGLFVCIDAVKQKSKAFVVVMSSLTMLLTLYSLGQYSVGDSDIGVILFQFGDKHIFYKRSVKRTCFFQIFAFCLGALFRMIEDKTMEKMLFATDNVYRATGTASKYREDINHSMLIRRETAEDIRKCSENRSSSKRLVRKSPKRPVRKKILVRKKTVQLNGNEVELDELLISRVALAERIGFVSLIIGVISYMINASTENVYLNIVAIVGSGLSCLCLLVIIYKNLSFAIGKRVLKEVTVVMIFVLGLLVFIIECVKPLYPLAPAISFTYFVFLSLFVCLDAVRHKSRAFVVIVSSVVVATTLYLVAQYSIGDRDIGVILFQYDDHYVYRKRSIKRALFVQIFFFSLNGLVTIVADKKMEKMIFATDSIYRATGTASTQSAITEDRNPAEAADGGTQKWVENPLQKKSTNIIEMVENAGW